MDGSDPVEETERGNGRVNADARGDRRAGGEADLREEVR
jgi:hypothetical protein